MLTIAWYSRDGVLHLYPHVAAALRQQGLQFEEYHVCNNELEAEILRTEHQLTRVTALGPTLQQDRVSLHVSDETLRDMEHQYPAMPLIRAAWSEMFEVGGSEQQLVGRVVGHIRFWERYFRDNHIDVFVAEVPSILAVCASWVVARRLALRTLNFIDIAPLGTRFAASTSWEGHYDEFADALASVSPSRNPAEYAKAAAYLEKAVKAPEKTPESHRKLRADVYNRIPLETIRHVPGLLKREQLRRQYYINNGGVQWLKRWARSYANRRIHGLVNVFDRPLAGERFFLLPLHERGEWSNYTWMGPDYGDPIHLVAKIAACLPFGSKLYVKEHTSGFGERPPSFYRQLSALRGVRVLSPYEDGFELMTRAQAVITLGSSMGFESWLRGRPVVLLGDPWYAECPHVQRARTPEQLADLLQRCSSLPLASTQEKLRAIAALYAISFEAYKLPDPRALTPENYSAWASALATRLAPPAGSSRSQHAKTFDGASA